MVLWRRGSSVLTARDILVTRDQRYRLVDGYNLEIRNVMPQDAGDYVCQISAKDNKDLVHTVEILGKCKKNIKEFKVFKYSLITRSFCFNV